MLASISAAPIGRSDTLPVSRTAALGRQAARGSSVRARRAMTTASSNEASAATAAQPIHLKAKRVTAEAFKPFGQARLGSLVEPGEDGAVFGAEDAQLTLTNGTPRFYIMKLKARGLQFDRITHHKKVTQCLAAANENEWYLAVAQPSEQGPKVEDITVFQIPPGVAVQMKMGTWHSGPYFENRADMGFFNLEARMDLSDTNIMDHTTHVYKGQKFAIDKP